MLFKIKDKIIISKIANYDYLKCVSFFSIIGPMRLSNSPKRSASTRKKFL